MIHKTAIIGAPAESRELFDVQWLPARDHLAVTDRIAYDADKLDVYVADSAVIGAYVTIDAGTGDNCTIIDKRSWLMKHVHVGHDAIIGEDVEVAPGAVIAGFAILRDKVKVGINASILPYVCVGEGAVVGAGAVVTKHVLPGRIVGGNPATLIRGTAPGLVLRSGDYRCGCNKDEVWDGCPHHGSNPVC